LARVELSNAKITVLRSVAQLQNVLSCYAGMQSRSANALPALTGRQGFALETPRLAAIRSYLVKHVGRSVGVG
jgi:hypothetical protein